MVPSRLSLHVLEGTSKSCFHHCLSLHVSKGQVNHAFNTLPLHAFKHTKYSSPVQTATMTKGLSPGQNFSFRQSCITHSHYVEKRRPKWGHQTILVKYTSRKCPGPFKLNTLQTRMGQGTTWLHVHILHCVCTFQHTTCLATFDPRAQMCTHILCLRTSAHTMPGNI